MKKKILPIKYSILIENILHKYERLTWKSMVIVTIYYGMLLLIAFLILIQARIFYIDMNNM